MATNDQMQKHLKRWQNWNKQLQLQKLKLNSKQEFDKYANNIVEKLNKPLNKQIENSLKHQIENINSCGICLDVMMSPKQPYSIYPCGHSFCKKCLFNNKNAKDVRNLELKVCPYCRERIEGCALNLSLLQMIRKSEETNKVEGMDRESIDIRYKIVSNQLKEMKSKLTELSTQLGVKERVEKKLLDDKLELKKEMQKLKEEENLIESHRASLGHQMKILRQLIETTTEKYLLLEKTHQEIRIQKDKNNLF